MGVEAGLTGRRGAGLGLSAAAGAGVAGDEQAQGAGHALGAGLEAAQAGAVRTQAPAFALALAQHVRIVEDMLAPRPPAVLFLAFLRHGRRVVVQLQQAVAKAGDVVADLLFLAGALGPPLGLADVARVQAGQRQTDAQVHIGQGAADGVAAFQHGDVRVKGAVEGRVALGRELHVGQRVREVVVLPGGVDDQIGLEVRQHGQHGVLDGVKVALVRGLGR